MKPVIVVGLGNPGAVYEETRHNIGFMVVDELTRRYRVRMSAGRGEFWAGGMTIGGAAVVLLKPATYMNNSGLAVQQALALIGAEPSDLLLVVDDVALPLGTLRLRASGSDGGHNGLYSVIYSLKTDRFARLRCGIRQEEDPQKGTLADFVLSPFETSERTAVRSMVERAADAVTEVAGSGLERTMSKFNH